MRKIDVSCLSGVVRIVLRAEDSRSRACELGMLQKGRGTIPLS